MSNPVWRKLCARLQLLSSHMGENTTDLHEAVNEIDRLHQIADNLATGIRMLKAYPKSREERIDKLLDYLHRSGYGGSPLRTVHPKGGST